MTTFTIYAGTTDGLLTGVDADYATAQASADSAETAGGSFPVGQRFVSPNYQCWEGFLEFDTSVIGAGATVNSATLSLDGFSDNSATDFTAEAWQYDWGGTLETADWRTPVQVAALTKLATFASSGYSTGYNDFTSQAAFPGAVNLSGFTRMVLASDRFTASTTPTGEERINFSSANAAGTTEDPKLVVDATVPVSLPIFDNLYRTMRAA